MHARTYTHTHTHTHTHSLTHSLTHQMQLQDSSPKWKCDLCKRSQSNTPRRLRCARCNFDAYEECRKRCSDASFRMFAGAKCKRSAWLLEGPSGDGWPPSGRQPGGRDAKGFGWCFEYKDCARSRRRRASKFTRRRRASDRTGKRTSPPPPSLQYPTPTGDPRAKAG